MKMTVGCAVRQHTTAQQELDLSKTEMSQTVVPAKKLFFRLRQVDVVGADDRKGSREGLDCCHRVIVVMDLSGRKIVSWIDSCHDGVPGWVAC